MLHLRDYASRDEAFHLGRRSTAGGFRGTLHTHDFAEIFWIERGSLTHLVNGERRPLLKGDVVFVRPDDVHTFRSAAGETFAQVSLAFARETLRFLERRYFDAADWPWRDGALPATCRLEHVQLARLQQLAALLVAGPSTRLLLERFLLEVLHDLADPPTEPWLPPWLSEALNRCAEDPEALSRGVSAVAELAGRSREHVNRIIKQRTARTATALVNDLRLDRAATELKLTDESIARIAVDCGLANLSHFYRLFNARFGVTPRQYRLAHQSPIEGSSVSPLRRTHHGGRLGGGDAAGRSGLTR